MKKEQINMIAYSLNELSFEESEQINGGGLHWAGGQGVVYQVAHWTGEIIGATMMFMSGTTM